MLQTFNSFSCPNKFFINSSPGLWHKAQGRPNQPFGCWFSLGFHTKIMFLSGWIHHYRQRQPQSHFVQISLLSRLLLPATFTTFHHILHSTSQPLCFLLSFPQNAMPSASPCPILYSSLFWTSLLCFEHAY